MALVRESSTTYSSQSPSVTLTGGLSNALVIAIIKGDAGAVRTLDDATLDGASADFMQNLNFDSGRAVSSAVYYWLDGKHPGAGVFSLNTVWSGAINNVQMEVMEYSGAHQTTTTSTIATNTAADIVDGSTITSTLNGQTGELAVSFEAQADSTAASLSGSLTPSVNLSSLTGPNVFLGQSRLAVAEAASVTSSSENYTWTISQNGMTVTDSLVTGSFAIFAAADSGVTVTPATINSSSASLNPTIEYKSLLQLSPLSINSSSISLDPVIGFSSVLTLSPNAVNSDSLALNPTILFSGSLEINSEVVNSSSVSLNPSIQFSSSLNLTPSVVNTLSVALNPLIEYTSALVIAPQTINSASISIDPLIEFKSVINLTPDAINSLSVANNPVITTGEVQKIGTVTAGFADDLYSVKYKLSGITVNFKE